MRRKSYLIKGLIAWVAVAMVFLLVPSAAFATIYPFSRFFGPVLLDGQSVPAGSTVSAFIDGMAAGTGTTYMQGSESWYILDSPQNTGGQNKNGGVDGDIVRFSLTVNGSVRQDPATAVWQSAANVYHRIAVSGPNPLTITTSALNNATMSMAYSFTMAASGGTGAYHWSATGLPADLIIGASNGVITGTPTVSGNFTPVAITVMDSASPAISVTKTYTLQVSPPPPSSLAITTSALSGATQGGAYSFTMAATGGTGAYHWSATGLPADLIIGALNGVITGTAAVSGNFTPVAITVMDSASPAISVTRTYTLQVSPPSGLTITTLDFPRTTLDFARSPVEVFPANPLATWLPLPVPGWIINQAYSTTMMANGGTGALTWSVSGLPSGLTLNASTGVISGIPTQDGLFEIVVDVHDSASPPNTAHLDPPLKIYKKGDANGNGTVSIADVTYCERAILGLSAPTAGCDANISNSISIADVTKIERIILGLP